MNADAVRRGRTGKVIAADEEGEELLEYDDMDHCPRQVSSAGWAGLMGAASAGAAGAVPASGQSGHLPTGISSTASITSTSVHAYAAPPSVPPSSQGSLRGNQLLLQQQQQPQPPRWDHVGIGEASSHSQPAPNAYPGAATSTGHGPGRGAAGGTSRREQAERLVRDRQAAATAAAAALVVAAGVAGLAYRLGQAAIGRVEVVDPNAPDEREQQQQQEEEAEPVGLPTVNLKKDATAVHDRDSFMDGSADGRSKTNNLTDLDEFQEAPEHMRPVVESVEPFVAAPDEAVDGTAAALASAGIDTNSIGIQTSIPVAGTAVGTADASVQTSVQAAQAAVQTSSQMPAPAAAALVTATAVAETTPPPVLEAPVFHIGRDGLRVLSENLGRGAFGIVRGGRFSGTEVAVKLQIRRENETPEEVQQKQEEFEREVAVLLHLRHPNIVLLYGVDPEKNALLVERAVNDLYHCIQSPLIPPYSEAPGGKLW